jgi:hypothetical protein
MAAFTKFYSFTQKLAEANFNLSTDSLKVALTNTQPVASTATQLSNITEISYTYCSTRAITRTSATSTNGVYKLINADLTLTATGGAVGPFQWIVIYDDTHASDLLIGYYSLASALTLNSGESYKIDFDDTNGFIQI